jgi:hypothetical protein
LRAFAAPEVAVGHWRWRTGQDLLRQSHQATPFGRPFDLIDISAIRPGKLMGRPSATAIRAPYGAPGNLLDDDLPPVAAVREPVDLGALIRTV